MKLTKSQVCVYIENEAQLQEAKELLEKYGEEIDGDEVGFNLTEPIENYLRFMYCGWSLNIHEDLQQITLQELETILKEQS